MQYLGLALYAEGPTDYYFLLPLLQRLCEDICTREASASVEINEVLALDHPVGVENEPRDVRILEAAKTAQGAWTVLFVHADGANDPARARAQQADPALARLQEEFGPCGLGVAVVPVRETEAWAIADGEALRQVLGTTLADGDLGLPTAAHQVEGVTDPKKTLNDAFHATRPSGSRRARGVSPYLSALGEQISLDRLRRLEAFVAFETELKSVLQALRILR